MKAAINAALDRVEAAVDARTDMKRDYGARFIVGRESVTVQVDVIVPGRRGRHLIHGSGEDMNDAVNDLVSTLNIWAEVMAPRARRNNRRTP